MATAVIALAGAVVYTLMMSDDAMLRRPVAEVFNEFYTYFRSIIIFVIG